MAKAAAVDAALDGPFLGRDRFLRELVESNPVVPAPNAG
jgi:hypothetical protein